LFNERISKVKVKIESWFTLFQNAQQMKYKKEVTKGIPLILRKAHPIKVQKEVS
jgi:hypothetical protein